MFKDICLLTQNIDISIFYEYLFPSFTTKGRALVESRVLDLHETNNLLTFEKNEKGRKK